MIARQWRGWAEPGLADEYQRHYEDEVSVHLTGVHGFRGALLVTTMFSMPRRRAAPSTARVPTRAASMSCCGCAGAY